MNLRDTNMLRISLLLAVLGWVGFFWSRATPMPDPGQAQVPAPAPVAAEPETVAAEPVQREDAASEDEDVATISREIWADSAQQVQRELIAAVLSGDEAAVERAQAKARALAARSAASAGH